MRGLVVESRDLQFVQRNDRLDIEFHVESSRYTLVDQGLRDDKNVIEEEQEAVFGGLASVMASLARFFLSLTCTLTT